MKEILKRLASGKVAGICSVCSAHPLVIEAALRFDLDTDRTVLIEATSNQVNQFGGYTGMTPAGFRDFVLSVADRIGFPHDRLWLGGDHLGPNCWRGYPADEAMVLSRTLVADYVKAGFRKIHLDASMAVKGEASPLAPECIAERAADLCAAAEAAADGKPPVYIIGTEVPVPGGESDGLSTVRVTTTDSVALTIATHQAAFRKRGLDAALERVIGVVVQPGVDFDHTNVVVYEPEKAADLVRFINAHPPLVFEAHSTDYQPREALRALVRDRFAILKVGPALTFALREGLFALAAIEEELIPIERRSHLRTVLDRTMLEEPGYWGQYYKGKIDEVRVLRAFSYSDRIRYYWNQPIVQRAVACLIDNLSYIPLPDGVLRQCAGIEKTQLSGRAVTPQTVIFKKITQVLDDYRYACDGDKIK